MARMTATECIHRYEALESERENLDGQLELLEKFVLPGKGRFFQEGHDEEESIDWRHREIYDGTAQNANTLLASNLHGSLTSPSTTWFELRFRDEELNEDLDASAWLEDCATRMRAAFTDSNFDLEVNEFYQDGSGFGTAVMLHNEEAGPSTEWNGHRFKAEMLRQCYFEEDSDGRPTAVFIKRSYTAMQLALRFGKDRLPQSVRDRLDNPGTSTTDKFYDAIYCVYLDEDKLGTDVSSILPVAQRPYCGRWVLVEGHEFIGDEQGFYELPAYVLRWQRTAGSKYGHSPGMIALGDILTLQEMVEFVRTATEKTVDPPLQHTVRGVLGDVDYTGGGLTAVRKMGDVGPLVPPNSYRIDTGWADINDMRSRIERMFFVDQLQLKESPQMTATEVQVRYEMMQRVLGPTLGRIQTDFLDPLIERSFWMMFRKGALKAMPEVVKTAESTDLDIEYVGPLARAQRMQSVDAIQRWLGMLAQMAEFKPKMLDLPDEDAIGRYIAETLGVPAKLVLGETEVQAKREKREQQMQQVQGVEMAQGMARAAKDAAGAGIQLPQAGANGAAPPGGDNVGGPAP